MSLVNGKEETARKNHSTSATFTHSSLENPFAQGSFRWVAKGKYTEGSRKDEPCVTKWFKSGGVMEDEFYDDDIKSVEKSIELLTKWNEGDFINKHIKINKPTVWTFTPDSSEKWRGQKTLVEPFIENYEKFNSNTGWGNNDVPWGKVMQAVSHFTYHISQGNMIMCDLQGGKYNNGVILTDPVIMSMDQSYGVTDLGPKGISTFFGRHICNSFCRSSWDVPYDRTLHFTAKQGTSMMSSVQRRRVPTLHSRAYLTKISE